MPLGKLSRKHIESGYGVLTEIQEAIKAEPVSEGRLLALRACHSRTGMIGG